MFTVANRDQDLIQIIRVEVKDKITLESEEYTEQFYSWPTAYILKFQTY